MLLTFPRILSSLVSALCFRRQQQIKPKYRRVRSLSPTNSPSILLSYPNNISVYLFFFFIVVQKKIKSKRSQNQLTPGRIKGEIDGTRLYVPPSNGNTRPCIIFRLQLYTYSFCHSEFPLGLVLWKNANSYCRCHTWESARNIMRCATPFSAARFNGTDKYKYYTVRQI